MSLRHMTILKWLVMAHHASIKIILNIQALEGGSISLTLRLRRASAEEVDTALVTTVSWPGGFTATAAPTALTLLPAQANTPINKHGQRDGNIFVIQSRLLKWDYNISTIGGGNNN